MAPKQADPKLETYRAKRDASETPEPFGRIHIPQTGSLFVVQQHAASHLHFDFRFEHGGVLKSWAVPKGPSDDPSDKRFAAETEDHPLDYADFEGEIPPGNYGAGHVIVWDRGTYKAVNDIDEGFKKGKLLLELTGQKLKGRWTLVRLKTKDSTGKEWLLIKEHDAYVSEDGPTFVDTSVLSGLTVQQLKKPAPKVSAFKRKLGRTPGTKQTPIQKITTKPMLATAGDAHNRKGWIWELKYDGYRILIKKSQDGIQLITRNGHDLASRFPEICQVVQHLPIDEFVIDGELVVNDVSGKPSFALMQQRGRATSGINVARTAIELPATYFAFDALFAAGHDLRKTPLLARKALLKQLLPDCSALRYSEHINESGQDTYRAAVNMGIEGVVGKRGDAPYVAGRSQDWVKVRNNRTAEFVVVGWSGSKNNPDDIGSLALAEYRGPDLAYVGHAGSGLPANLRSHLTKAFKKLSRKTCPLPETPETKKPTHWLRPHLVVEIAYTEYTPYGHLRHPSIQRIRDDKVPNDCHSQFDGAATEIPLTQTPEVTIEITNPDKVFYPEPGFTKSNLVEYYRAIAPWMLPHLARRPIVLTRYPDGVDGKSFYQRDIPDYVPDWLQREVLWSESTEREVKYVIARTAEDLAYLGNMGTIPIHMWHATLDHLDHPDWCVLDLDPKKAPFSDVITLALAIGELADELELPAFPKTSGASGLHILIPLNRQLTHDQSQTLGELLARVIVDRYPDIATIERIVWARGNKVYIDYLQNGHGQLIVAPFSARAEQAGSVSMPLHWHEINRGLSNQKYHIGNAVTRLKRMKSDPSADLLTTDADLARALGLLAELVS